MEESLRPSRELIKKAYNHLFDPGTSVSKIRDSALADRLLPYTGDSAQTAGRSMAWKLFLTLKEPLQSSSMLRSTTMVNSLRISRQRYVKYLYECMRAPDGSYEEGFVLPGFATPGKQQKTVGNLETNNPLSLHNENPWKEWFEAVELRRTILQDVERTFPEIGFFRDPEVHVQLSNILFLYSVRNPSIGYRQGMHEVLAPLYYAVDHDSISQDENSEDPDMGEICSKPWVAADAWALFDNIMRGLSKWYEWREPLLNPPLSNHTRIDITNFHLDIKPYVAPIVEACNRIQSDFLRAVDPLLWKHMQAVGIEPQIYGIRWLRLLFTREFSMNDAMKLWDSLFACDATLELAQWVCVAMLIRIRNELIPADYSTQLTILLRYPSTRSLPAFDGAPHHATLLVRQALTLQMSPTPSTGTSLMLENRNLLNIPVEVTAPTLAPQPTRNQSFHNKAASVHGQSSLDSHSRQATSPQPSLPEMITRGLLGRGESLGINKTLMNAVSEIRRNIPELAVSLVRSPNAPYSTFPLMGERPPDGRSAWEPRTRFEMERDMARLRSTNKRLGESLGRVVDALLQDEAEVDDLQRLKKRKQEALESLAYVRDVLIGNVTEIEEDRLIGEEEFRKWKESESTTHRGIPAVADPPPVSVPVVELQQPSRLTHPPPRLNSFTGSSTSRSSSFGPPHLPPSSYTRSTFSGVNSSLPVEGLPRLPPASGQPRQSASKDVTTDVSPHRLQVQRDPLGVLG